MLSQKSIRDSFILQLVSASATLIVIFSVILYNYIKISIFEDITNELTKQAQVIASSRTSSVEHMGINIFNPSLSSINHPSETQVTIAIRVNQGNTIAFEHSEKNHQKFLTIFYPLEKRPHHFVSITKNISNTDILLDKIFTNVLIINLTAIFLILFYALFLSRMLVLPIRSLTNKLANMNENFLQMIDTKTLPAEFLPLGSSINKLVERIQIFVNSQKELFIGAAHELKTPLAVMKTKNEVTLLKLREAEKYIETLKSNNQTINDMNKMIGNILEIGRQEGAQFEKPIEIDLITFLKEQINNYTILAKMEEKELIARVAPKHYKLTTQPTLLVHILQNFVQNAIKFTPKYGKITVQAHLDAEGFFIYVIDEGSGIDESKDLFAPFKRYGNQTGAGLGLFLAKNAADALGAKITLKNREDAQGTIATLFLPSKKHAL
ncbi:sensor histidine kinase [Sulfurospirillum deleyianum]|uniref:histidine kinase n=1 Tax=Sulfurospirillum deleyianum (strain ATCC 51133 / DSM 6946 / 5175) TaxID=525898 RepID=D1B0F3_SULD5|nr:HAMP domain-containing sensor histidine kinase [Sulfurospirillum deleyianum]ACZ11272.1 ATP-binding region ATPase domain protein [Sulfurospirillum deleyianum DSM 6946]